MRSQFFDGFNFNDKKYSLVAIEKPDELFNIKSLPLRPTVFDESCLSARLLDDLPAGRGKTSYSVAVIYQ